MRELMLSMPRLIPVRGTVLLRRLLQKQQETAIHQGRLNAMRVSTLLKDGKNGAIVKEIQRKILEGDEVVGALGQLADLVRSRPPYKVWESQMEGLWMTNRSTENLVLLDRTKEKTIVEGQEVTRAERDAHARPPLKTQTQTRREILVERKTKSQQTPQIRSRPLDLGSKFVGAMYCHIECFLALVMGTSFLLFVLSSPPRRYPINHSTFPNNKVQPFLR